MIIFWLIALCLVTLAFLFILPPLFKRHGGENAIEQNELNVVVRRDQLRELELDLQNGAISQEQYAQAQAELERALLEDVTNTSSSSDEALQAVMSKASAWFIILALPLVSIMLYSQIGGGSAAMNPQASQVALEAEGHQGSIQDMVTTLEARLKENPQDAEGWSMLARSYYFLQDYNQAVAAYAKAVELTGGQDPNLLADYADTMGLLNGRNLTGQPKALIQQALAVNPNHVKALWLAGTAAYQGQNYAEAVQYWERVLPLLPPDSENFQAIQGAIAEASQQMGEPAQATAPDQAAGNIAIRGVVELDSDLAGQATATDTVFIFARAASGPGMPLAIVRKQVQDLPVSFVLDDSMAMTPAMKLSGFSSVVVGARISASGSAIPQSGDLQGFTSTINPADGQDVRVVIDQRVD